MIRAYALALGAASQQFTLGIRPTVFGSGPLAHDLSLGAAWVINLVVAELIIRRSARRATVRAGS